MTFTNFLQVLAFNLLSQIVPMCAFLGITMYFTIKYFDKRIANLVCEQHQHKKKNESNSSLQ